MKKNKIRIWCQLRRRKERKRLEKIMEARENIGVEDIEVGVEVRMIDEGDIDREIERKDEEDQEMEMSKGENTGDIDRVIVKGQDRRPWRMIPGKTGEGLSRDLMSESVNVDMRGITTTARRGNLIGMVIDVGVEGIIQPVTENVEKKWIGIGIKDERNIIMKETYLEDRYPANMYHMNE